MAEQSQRTSNRRVRRCPGYLDPLFTVALRFGMRRDRVSPFRKGETEMNWKIRPIAFVSMFMIGLLTVVVGLENSSAQENIKIGVFAPLSGSHANTGQRARDGIDMVVQEVNGSGGLLGKKIEIIYEDDAAKPDEAVNVVNRFI